MNVDLFVIPTAVWVLMGVAGGVVMTLYWEWDAVRRFAAELGEVVRGVDADRRRKRLLLLALAIATILIGFAVTISNASNARTVTMDLVDTRQTYP